MALERNSIRVILENAETSMDDKINAVLNALHKEVDPLKDQLETEKSARTAAEQQRDAADTGRKNAEQALNDYKSEQLRKDTHEKKVNAFKSFALSLGCSKNFPDARDLKAYAEEIDALELDETGKAVNTAALAEQLKREKPGIFLRRETRSEPLDNPPEGYHGVTREQFAAMSLDERIRLKNSNPELYRQLRTK